MFTGGFQINPKTNGESFWLHQHCFSQPRQGHPPPSQARTAFELPSHLPPPDTPKSRCHTHHISSCPANVSLKEPIDPRIFRVRFKKNKNTWQSQCLAARIINTVTAGFYIISESERRNGARLLTPSLPS